MFNFVRQTNPDGVKSLLQDAAGLVAICILLVAGLGLPSIT